MAAALHLDALLAFQNSGTLDVDAITQNGSTTLSVGGVTGNITQASTGNFLDKSITTGITAHSGGTKAAAVQLTSDINVVSTAAATTDSVGLPLAVAGMEIVVINNTASNANVVFTAAGSTDTINALATTASFSVANATATIFYCVTSAPAGLWLTK